MLRDCRVLLWLPRARLGAGLRFIAALQRADDWHPGTPPFPAGSDEGRDGGKEARGGTLDPASYSLSNVLASRTCECTVEDALQGPGERKENYNQPPDSVLKGVGMSGAGGSNAGLDGRDHRVDARDVRGHC